MAQMIMNVITVPKVECLLSLPHKTYTNIGINVTLSSFSLNYG